MHTISSLSEGLDISRQGARKHLQILAEAHLIVLESQGRKTTVRLDREVFDKGREFIVELELQWDKRLGALRELLEPPTGKIVENRTR